MKNRKKIMSVLAVGCMAASTLMSGNFVFAEGEKEVDGKLVIWEHTAQFENPLKEVIAGFQKLYPNVEIEYQIKTSDQYYNLLQTAMQAGETPDLFWTNGTATTNLQTYAKQGLLMDLTDKVDFSMYDGTQAMDICTIDDKGGLHQREKLVEEHVSITKTFLTNWEFLFRKHLKSLRIVSQSLQRQGIYQSHLVVPIRGRHYFSLSRF